MQRRWLLLREKIILLKLNEITLQHMLNYFLVSLRMVFKRRHKLR